MNSSHFNVIVPFAVRLPKEDTLLPYQVMSEVNCISMISSRCLSPKCTLSLRMCRVHRSRIHRWKSFELLVERLHRGRKTTGRTTDSQHHRDIWERSVSTKSWGGRPPFKSNKTIIVHGHSWLWCVFHFHSISYFLHFYFFLQSLVSFFLLWLTGDAGALLGPTVEGSKLFKGRVSI